MAAALVVQRLAPVLMRPRLQQSDMKDAADTYLAACFEHEIPPRATELAAHLQMSPSYFSRAFRKHVGKPLSAYLKDAQIVQAKYLLRTTSLSINGIAYRAGFGTRRGTFFRAFRRVTGITPAQYREHSKDA